MPLCFRLRYSPELAKKLEDKRAADAKAVLEKDAAVSAELNSEV